MDESTSAALLRLAEAVEQETRAMSRIVYTLADKTTALEKAVARLDREMAELRDELLTRPATLRRPSSGGASEGEPRAALAVPATRHPDAAKLDAPLCGAKAPSGNVCVRPAWHTGNHRMVHPTALTAAELARMP